MLQHLRANLWLLVLTLLLCSVLYPLALLGIGNTFFRDKAEGSLLLNDGKPVGSRLIAQPFQDKDGNTKDEYFQPRPSAASYKANASGASNLAASNYQLRDRVARALGPIVKYGAAHPKKGQLVGPDIEAWFLKDQFAGKPHIVAQWASLHTGLASAWVKTDKLNSEYVAKWQKENPEPVRAWIAKHPDTPDPRPEDLARAFFESYSHAFPGTWPVAITPEGKTDKEINPVKKSSDIQSVFFDMWRQDHPDEDLENVPADMVMASGSGLDPHITLKNAEYQRDRVAKAWANKTNGNQKQIADEIKELLRAKSEAPLGGLVGVNLINVLEVNLELRHRYGSETGGSN
jgi:K+-transporting ATPase ATPase C chain